MGCLTDDEIRQLNPSELLPHATPIPPQIVSSDEFTPAPQSEKWAVDWSAFACAEAGVAPPVSGT